MGNLIWTGIIYFCTIGVVFVTFRAFVEDGKEDKQGMTQLLVQRTVKAAIDAVPGERSPRLRQVSTSRNRE